MGRPLSPKRWNYRQDPTDSLEFQHFESGWDHWADEIHELDFWKSDQLSRHPFWSPRLANHQNRKESRFWEQQYHQRDRRVKRRWRAENRRWNYKWKPRSLRICTLHWYRSLLSVERERWAAPTLGHFERLQSETKTWLKRCSGTSQAHTNSAEVVMVHWWPTKNYGLPLRQV